MLKHTQNKCIQIVFQIHRGKIKINRIRRLKEKNTKYNIKDNKWHNYE